MTCGARRLSLRTPRSRVTRTSGPSNAWASVAPMHTRIHGFTTSISFSSHGRQAATVPQDAAIARDADVGPEQRLGGGRAHAHEDPRLHNLDFLLEPRQTGGDFPGIGLLVHAPAMDGDPLEMLHDVRDVRVVPLDARRGERLIEDAAGGTDERGALPVFHV